jgi:hypothetical protein
MYQMTANAQPTVKLKRIVSGQPLTYPIGKTVA